MQPPSVLILGNLLSSTSGTRGVGEDLAYRLSRIKWEVVSASSRNMRVARLLDMLLTTFRCRHRFDIAYVEVYSGPAFVWAELSCTLLRFLDKPVIITLHGGNLPLFAQRWPGRVNRLLQAADSVTTPSNYIQSAFASVRPDIVLLRNAIDLGAYSFQHRQQARSRLAWLRAFHTIYAPSLAAEVISLLVDEFPDIELTMFGPDKDDGSLRSMQARIQQTGIVHRIHIPGAIPKADVPTRLASFDIFLNTTTAESFGVAVVEAAALGMCIVTTDVGELPHIWTHEHDALLVPPNDPQAMADAVRRILTEPGLAERLSRNARETAEQFDWSIILPQWEALFMDVIERHSLG